MQNNRPHNYGGHFNQIVPEQKPENIQPENIQPENIQPENIQPENIQPENIQSSEPKIAIVIAKRKLNVRKLPWLGMESEMICQLNSGDKVQVDKIEDDWAHIYTSSGIEGYVMAEYIEEV